MSLKTSFPKEKINILLLENISEVAVQHFQAAGYSSVRLLASSLVGEELEAALKEVHILGIRSKTQITDALLAKAPHLLAMGCFSIGTNQVDLKAATKRGISVFNAPYGNTRSVAELTIGASIMLIRRIPDKNAAAHQHLWMKAAEGSHELRGKTMGIVGYGNIGTQVGILAESLGLKVLYYDVLNKLPLGNAQAAPNLQNLLQQSDIVTLHVPDLPGTRNMINQDSLKYMKKGALLINYSRGTIVDLEAVKVTLETQQLGGAAIDVYPVEPKKKGETFDCPLQGLHNVLLTPHIGGSTEEAQKSIGDDVSLKLINYLELGVTDGSLTIPNLNLPAHPGTVRILHLHKNVPGILAAINQQLSDNNINVSSQYLKTKNGLGYVVLDVDKRITQQELQALQEIEGTIKARIVY